MYPVAPTGEVKDTKKKTQKTAKEAQSHNLLVNGGLLFITDKSVAAAISMMEWLYVFLPFYSMTTIHRGG